MLYVGIQPTLFLGTWNHMTLKFPVFSQSEFSYLFIPTRTCCILYRILVLSKVNEQPCGFVTYCYFGTLLNHNNSWHLNTSR